jgi:hypothetical protein
MFNKIVIALMLLALFAGLHVALEVSVYLVVLTMIFGIVTLPLRLVYYAFRKESK